MRDYRRLTCIAGAVLLGTTAFNANAADLDGVIYTDDANLVKPAELGSGWYIRGDISYNTDFEQRQGFTFDEFSGANISYRYGDGVGYGVGFGKQMSPWLRWDITVERPVASDFDSSASTTFRGSRDIEYTYIDAGGDEVTETFGIDFDSDGIVTASECNAVAAAAGCPTIGDTVAAIDGSRRDELGYSLWTVLANAYVDLPEVARITPYVGAGIGMSRANAWYKLTVDCIAESDEACGYPAGSTGEVLEDIVLVDHSYSKWLPTWSLAAGLSYPVKEGVDVDLGYKFTRVQNIQSALDGSGVDLGKENLDIHSFRAGLRVTAW